MSWNEPGGNSSGNRNPWGKRPGQGPPDLDEVVRNLQRKFAGLFGGAGRGNGATPSGKGPGGLGVGVIVGIVILVWLASGLYVVDAAERAVITRFGKYVGIAQPGLRWHLPWPIESRQVVNIASIQSFAEQTRMLTSDENLVDINLAVQYRRADAIAVAFNVRDPEATLREVSESAIREVIGRSPLTAVLESGRQEIAARTKDLIQRTLDSYKTGIEVTSANLQGVSVPDPVAPAQQDAIKAREDKERLSLEAQSYANDILPKAGGSAARMLQDAQAYRAQKIANAEGESQRFLKLLPEYEQAPAVTRQRLYIETLEAVLASSKKIMIDTKGSGNMIYLPLDRLMDQSRAVSGAGNTITVRPVPTDNAAQETPRTRGTR